ncbi:MAG: glycoside hydrolase family 2 protein, partial [Acidimicrobiales bacterium]
ITVLIHARVTLDGTVRTERLSRHTLASGENRIRMALTVDEPDLWWPHALGGQPLHEVQITVLVPTDAADTPRRRSRSHDEEITAEEAHGHVPSDERRVNTGLRQIQMHNWILTVNGERLFVKGSNQGPSQMALAAATPDDLERDVVLARDAGLDLLRVHAHVSRPELYDAADRHGLLLWQDLPLQWAYARSVRRQAVRQAREAVDLLGHHPSVAVWCGHSEPFDPPNASKGALRHELPSWNKAVLDTSIGRALERADPTRPVIPHVGVWPDSHSYLGWTRGSERELPRLLARVPRTARFITEFGAQAVPSSAAWMQPEQWPDLDWEDLVAHHAMQRGTFDRVVPPDAFATFDAWREASQAHQATVIRFHIETLRRLKYRPTGGFCQFCFADGYPAVSWSVLDHDRQPKAGFAALAAACAPVIVVAERPAATYAVDQEIELDVHVISDLRAPLPETRIVATLGAQRWGWTGSIPADSCVKVGTIRGVAVDGPLRLSLAAGEVSAASSYPVAITR